jgi:hypothetical protein
MPNRLCLPVSIQSVHFSRLQEEIELDFVNFAFILFLTQLGAFIAGFLSVKINNLLIIIFGKLWSSGHAEKRYAVSGAIITILYFLIILFFVNLTTLMDAGLEIFGLVVLTAILIEFYVFGIYFADRRFSEAEIIMEKIVEATYAKGYSLDEEKIRVDSIKNINSTLQAMPESYKVALGLLFFIFDSAFMVFFIGLANKRIWSHRFIELELSQQEEYFKFWEKDRYLHYAVQALKSLVAFGYYTSPGTWNDIGYGGTLLGRSYWK